MLGSYCYGTATVLQLLLNTLFLALPEGVVTWLYVLEAGVTPALLIWGSWQFAEHRLRWRAAFAAFLTLALLLGLLTFTVAYLES